MPLTKTQTLEKPRTARQPIIQKIAPGFMLPSAAFTISRNKVKYFAELDKKPVAGDLLYGRVVWIGQHKQLENQEGRIHILDDGSRAIFVFGARYSPDIFEGVVPETYISNVDLLARSGIVGIVREKNSAAKDATKVELFGYVTDAHGRVINSRDYSLIHPRKTARARSARAKLILVAGTSMNAGKSAAAANCCWALSSQGYDVRGSKLTGTASLKDILHMQDAGASIVNDFTHFGYPSTYLLEEAELLRIFNDLDLKYGNNPRNYWVVELADGLLQRETAMLLRSQALRSRIHRFIFAARDAMGAIGGVSLLENEFNLRPDAISGICSSSPLAIAELQSQVPDIPIFNSLNRSTNPLLEILQ